MALRREVPLGQHPASRAREQMPFGFGDVFVFFYHILVVIVVGVDIRAWGFTKKQTTASGRGGGLRQSERVAGREGEG